MLSALIRDFRAEGAIEAAILARIKRFIAQNGEAAPGREIAGEIGHITVSAWIVDAQNSAVALVFGRKESAWKLPGAHNDGDLLQTARNEATRALGRAPTTQNPILWALAEREIPEYWQTPAHVHFELIFRFAESETEDLPRGARWFSLEEIALLNDAILARLIQKKRHQS